MIPLHSHDRKVFTEILLRLESGSLSYKQFLRYDFSNSLDNEVAAICSEIDQEIRDDYHIERPIELAIPTRGLINRSILLLKLNIKYEWPKSPTQTKAPELLALLCMMLSFTMMIVFGINIIVITLPVIIICIISTLISRARYHNGLYRWRRAGDIDAWPFVSMSQYEKAKLLDEKM